MFKAIIIDNRIPFITNLKENLQDYCPSIFLAGIASTEEASKQLIQDETTEIAFINPEIAGLNDYSFIKRFAENKALICISDSTDYAQIATSLRCLGYLLCPINPKALIQTIDAAKKFIWSNKELEKKANLIKEYLGLQKEERLIGVPTVDGFDIILIDHIIHCEGLQKYTRIITTQRTNIVSSYNIGVFKKLLNNYSFFFSPHRSHIINLLAVEKYKKSGTIILKSGTMVPIAKNQKENFMKLIIKL